MYGTRTKGILVNPGERYDRVRACNLSTVDTTSLQVSNNSLHSWFLKNSELADARCKKFQAITSSAFAMMKNAQVG